MNHVGTGEGLKYPPIADVPIELSAATADNSDSDDEAPTVKDAASPLRPSGCCRFRWALIPPTLYSMSDLGLETVMAIHTVGDDAFKLMACGYPAELLLDR